MGNLQLYRRFDLEPFNGSPKENIEKCSTLPPVCKSGRIVIFPYAVTENETPVVL